MAQSHTQTGWGPGNIESTSTGASGWMSLGGVHSKFGMMVVTSAATAATVALQGVLTTDSTTPLTLITSTVVTGVMQITTEVSPVGFVRTSCTALSTGTGHKVQAWIGALP